MLKPNLRHILNRQLYFRMCLKCLKETRPERGSSCLETGTYLVNYEMCSVCQKKTPIVLEDKDVDIEYAEDGEIDSETVTYNHMCGVCNHMIAQHYYNYDVDDISQEYTMECFLCGRGGNSIKFSSQEYQHAAQVISETVYISCNDNIETVVIVDKVVECVQMDDQSLSRITAMKTQLSQSNDNNGDNDDEWN